MKILTERNGTFDPFGQMLFFDDGSQEFDADCTQTTAILTAELYNGRAAKDDEGNWTPAPGPRQHSEEYALCGFAVGMTYIQHSGDGKALFDYSVTTPTRLVIHARPGYEIAVPAHWESERIAAEIIAWVCLSPEEIADWEGASPERLAWAASIECESARADIDEWIESYDRGFAQKQKEEHMSNLANDVEESRQGAIKARAESYVQELLHGNQTGLVIHLLEKGEYLTWEDVTHLDVDVDNMDGAALADFIEEELSEDWRKLNLVDIQDYIFNDEDDEQLIDPDIALADLNPLDLHDYDLEQLRDYIRENYTPGDIYEWHLVDEWLASELEQLGESTLTDGISHWWGRRTTGQRIIMDGILQQIAAKYIA